MEVWISPSNDPAVNLGLEEYFLQDQFSGRHLFFLYINRPCIVVGRNQCHFKEVNPSYWFREDCKIYRRVSGGGTVYHDQGNLNFASIIPHRDDWVNQYRFFNEPIRKIIAEFEINLEYDSRNNFLFRSKKVSGNAQFTNRKRMVSHGTFLVNANLEQLRSSLRKSDLLIESKSVSSVSSSVINLSDSGTITDARQLMEIMAKAIASDSPINKELPKDIEPFAAKYRSEEWCLNRSPECLITHPEGYGLKINAMKVTGIQKPELGWTPVNPVALSDLQKKWPTNEVDHEVQNIFGRLLL